MKTFAFAILAASAVSTLGACDLYFNNADDVADDDCAYYHTPPAELFRDPATGVCQPFGGGGGYPCDSYCGAPCAEPVDAGAPQPNWPTCYGSCAGLDEYTCGATPGCHQAFYDDSTGTGPVPPDGGMTGGGGGGSALFFKECWDISPLPTTTTGGQCYGLDAYSCAMADDCVSNMYATGYDANGNQVAQFASCSPESTTTWSCANTDCGIGYHCEEQCYPCDPTPGGMGCENACTPMCLPDAGQACDTVDCGSGYQCVEVCYGGGMTPPPGPMDPNVPTDPTNYCYATCEQIPNTPGECYGAVTCSTPAPACPVNTTAGVANGCYTGYCIPTDQCGPANPGTCEPADGTCLVGPPTCPIGSTPGTLGGCYTGYCIPNSSCPPVSCEATTDEMGCIARPDCTAVYTGDDCTCTPSGCTCTSQTFARCETLWWE